MKTIKTLFFFFSFLFISCQGTWYEMHLTGSFYMMAIDGEEDMSITDDGLVIIGSAVFAVGFNDEFIIAKQHPGGFINPPNKNITHYYIIVINKNGGEGSSYERIGPLTVELFDFKRKELNVPEDLSFTIIRKKLE